MCGIRGFFYKKCLAPRNNDEVLHANSFMTTLFTVIYHYLKESVLLLHSHQWLAFVEWLLV